MHRAPISEPSIYMNARYEGVFAADLPHILDKEAMLSIIVMQQADIKKLEQITVHLNIFDNRL